MDIYGYGSRSPFGILRQGMINNYSKSLGNLYWKTSGSLESPTNGSGFSPLRSPSRLVTMDGVRCHLRDLYLHQISSVSQLWSNLVKTYPATFSRRRLEKYRTPPLYPASKFLVIQSDENRVVNDFSKEMVYSNPLFKRRFKLTGEFGCGKTSLLSSLISNWCSDDSELFQRFPVLLYIRSEYAFGRRTLEEVLQNILPSAELKYVMRILNDRSTQNQVLILLDDCEKYHQPTIGVQSSKFGFDDEDELKAPNYPLDMNRIMKGLYLSESTVVCAGRCPSPMDGDVLKRNYSNYVIYGLDESVGVEFRCRNPLFLTLAAVLGDKPYTNERDVLFPGVERAVTEILARMSRPMHMDYEECIRILGLLSLISCQDYLPPLTLESKRAVDRKKELFRDDQRLSEDADELLRAAVDAGLLITPGTGRLLKIEPALLITDSYSSKKQYDYVLAFPHESFALYLAARTFVSLNLNMDWTRIQQRGNRLGVNSYDWTLTPNEKYMFYFLTGIDRGYAQDLLLRGVRREHGTDRGWILNWMVAETARDASKSITAYTDDHFVVNGSNECSDSVLLNKLTIYYRSAQERALDFDGMLLKEEYDYEGTSITALRFRQCSVHDQFLRLSSRRLFDVLTTLEFFDCQFYEEGVINALLMRLASNSSTLTALKMGKCQKLAESVDLMRTIGCQLLKLHTLQISDVRDTERSQKAAFALAESLEKSVNLRKLILSKNDVADILFTVVVYELELDELDVSNCRMADDARMWRKFVDALTTNVGSPLRKSLISLKADENPHLADTFGLRHALESCDRLKLISLRNCFRSSNEAEAFKDIMRKKMNGNGLRRDVFV